MKIRDEVLEFSKDMERVLQDNDFKGHWDDDSIEFLFAKLIEEVGEIGKLLARTCGKGLEGGGVKASDVVHECIDVANVSMMLASKYRSSVASQNEKEDEE